MRPPALSMLAMAAVAMEESKKVHGQTAAARLGRPRSCLPRDCGGHTRAGL